MGIFNSEVKMFRDKKLNGFGVVLSATLLISVMWSSAVSALGMGAATAKSHIGEPLSVSIPIFNVKDPNNLSVILQRTDSSVSDVPLQAKVEHVNFQLAISVTSLQATNEPYISFVVEVVDGSDLSSKEFTVLLDLKPGRQASQPFVSSSTRPTQNIVSQPPFIAGNSQVNSSAFSNASTGSILGPYDWAEAGRVPESFGPVLDGQSLWRVARRINEAHGVSIDQMMWSLYEANRDKFSTDSITSLKAGSILKIPSAAQARQLTELQAKDRVQRASATNFSNSNASSAVNSNAQTSSVAQQAAQEPSDQVEETSQTTKSVTTAQPFNLTGLDSDGSLSGQPTGAAGEQSQQIIASLAEAVGNLTQEVIKKDKKISFLEEKVAALEDYAQISSADLLPAKPQSNSATDASPVADNEENKESQEKPLVAPVVEDKPNVVEKNNVAIESKEVEVKKESKEQSFMASFSLWHLLIAVLLLLLIVGFLFRERLMDLFESLNFGNKDNEIEFDPTMFEQSVQVLDESMVDPDLTVENNKPRQNGLSQSSILDAIKTAVQSEDPLSPQTLIDLDGEFSFTEVLSEASEDEGASDLNFMERFENAVNSSDFGFARQLLGFAKEGEIDLPSYHYHRLRLCEAMNDEDAFYDYYCEVEQLVPSFDTDLQTKISQLVLKMAQN